MSTNQDGNKQPRPVTTNDAGIPAPSDEHSLTAGPGGPILLQDSYLIQKMAHFNRERVPERVVHAKGSGAFGYFEVTADCTPWTKAAFLNKVGKRTPMLARFSTVAGEQGYADTDRDPRGFALKFYTEEGNYDMVGNNTPVFFVRDPQKFQDFIHSQKRMPDTGLRLRRYVFLVEISGNFGAVTSGEFARIGMNRFRPVVDDKEKENADEQIKSQRMHVTHPATSQELVSQMPGTRNQPSDRCKKLRFKIQEGIKGIDNDMAKGAPIIDRRLAAVRTPSPGQ